MTTSPDTVALLVQAALRGMTDTAATATAAEVASACMSLARIAAITVLEHTAAAGLEHNRATLINGADEIRAAIERWPHDTNTAVWN